MQIKTPKTRGQIRKAVSDLQRADHRLAELAESLALPPDVAEMWEGTVPKCFTANLYSAIDAVRSDCIQDAVATLLHAVGRSEESLRYEWCKHQEKQHVFQSPGGVLKDSPEAVALATAEAAATKEAPQC